MHSRRVHLELSRENNRFDSREALPIDVLLNHLVQLIQIKTIGRLQLPSEEFQDIPAYLSKIRGITGTAIFLEKVLSSGIAEAERSREVRITRKLFFSVLCYGDTHRIQHRRRLSAEEAQHTLSS